MNAPMFSTVQRGTTPGLAAHELQEKLLREARLSTSPLQRKLNNTQEEVMRRFYAHPVVKGGE